MKVYETMDMGHTSSGQRVDIFMAAALTHLFEGSLAEAKVSIEAAKA